MTTYVDTSTLLKLIVDEPGSDRASIVWQSADALASAHLVVVEARAALAAAHRHQRLTSAEHRRAIRALGGLVDEMHLVAIGADLIGRAADLAEQEALRGYDAVHLAAALLVEATVFTSADADLCAAATRHGLHIANPLADGDDPHRQRQGSHGNPGSPKRGSSVARNCIVQVPESVP